MNLLKLIILIIIIILILFKLQKWKYKLDVKKRQDIPSNIRLPILYKLMEIVSKISNLSQTKPFILYGTLLGYARDKNIICYDFDLDYGIISNEYNIFKTNINKILENYPEYKVYYEEYFGYRKIVIKHEKTFLNADIFEFIINENNIKRNAPFWVSLFIYKECRASYPIDWILPLQKDTINNNNNVYIPNNYNKLLSCYYGNNYMIPNNICDVDCNNCVIFN
jgi:hypothetical protein